MLKLSPEKNLLKTNFDIGRLEGDILEFEFGNAGSKYVFKGRITGSEIIGILNNDSNMRVIGRRAPS